MGFFCLSEKLTMSQEQVYNEIALIYQTTK